MNQSTRDRNKICKNAPIYFAVSVRPSSCNNSKTAGPIFFKICRILGKFTYVSLDITVMVKSGKNNGHFFFGRNTCFLA